MCDGSYFLRRGTPESPLSFLGRLPVRAHCLHMDPDPQYLAMYSTLGMVATLSNRVFWLLKKVELRCSYGINLLSRSDSLNIPPNGSESDDNEANEWHTLVPSKGLINPSSPTHFQLSTHSCAAPLQPTDVFVSERRENLAR